MAVTRGQAFLVGLVALLLIGGAFAIGLAVGDDSEMVAVLREDVDDLETDLARAEEDLDLAQEQLELLASDAISPEEYAGDIQRILTTFGEESIDLGSELSNSTSTKDLESGVDSLSNVTSTAVDDLNSIDPPAEAAVAHETLTAALEDYLGDIETLLSDLGGASAEETQQAALDFQESATEVQTDLEEAAQQLQEAGIDTAATP